LDNSLVYPLKKDKMFISETYAASSHQPNVGHINIIEFLY